MHQASTSTEHSSHLSSLPAHQPLLSPVRTATSTTGTPYLGCLSPLQDLSEIPLFADDDVQFIGTEHLSLGPAYVQTDSIKIEPGTIPHTTMTPGIPTSPIINPPSFMDITQYAESGLADPHQQAATLLPQLSPQFFAASVSQQRKLIPILPAIKQEPNPEEQPSCSSTFPPVSHAPFSVVSEQTWVAVKEEAKTSPSYEEQQCHYVASTDSDEESGSDEETEITHMKTLSVPDELNPQKTADLGNLLSKMELECGDLKDTFEKYFKSLPTIERAKDQFAQIATTIGSTTQRKRYLKLASQRIRKYKNKISAQESRQKKKNHLESLEKKVRNYEHRLNRISNITANLKVVLQRTAIPQRATELFQEIQKLSSL
ncbi:bZIP transcription factor [Kistimonas asteriae]|uniref:bZIP transcription factor n=1 Tax=Kistimonas asteriae TaxID=517724 RepID=UPI001BA5339C|nr:bZIP transcription factor [Kistimonas asteriae]